LAEGVIPDGPLNLAGVIALRGATGETGAWASRIAADLETRAAHLKEPHMDAPAAPADEMRVYGAVLDPVAHSIMAADAAMDAAAGLLMGNTDAVVSQAYYLICAADAALQSAVMAMGLVDADDEGEAMPADDMQMMMMPEAPRAEELVLESRRGLLAAAERITVDAEVRALADGGMRIGGYAAKFNREATGLSFREVIAPGAFTRSLASAEPVYLLVNHDTDQLPLASTRSGTLVLSEDNVGLYMTADLDPSNPRAAELHSALSRGDVEKMSFAFSIAPGGESRDSGLRTLTDLNLFEVSVVTWPAYDDTEVGVRSEESAGLFLRRRLAAAHLNYVK